ncbi:MAG: tRNA pseudouridine(38-40) synthase TruA [Planctomycetales bacterium]|nr:tRNA pseudouridine(38-40) synthase TruA [Planctomycetales bacterium]
MRFLKLTVAYDGTDYVGWQVQPNGPSIQAAVESAWREVTGEALRVTASGRTDSGVHALGQVVSLATDSTLPCQVLLRALNANLPEDIVTLGVQEAPDGFDAILSAVRKRYRYLLHDGRLRDPLLRRYSWQVFRPLNEAAMQLAANSLVGTHDFASFQSAGSPRASTIRTISDLVVRRQPVCSPFRLQPMPGIDIPTNSQVERSDAASEESQATADSLHRSQTQIVVEVEANGFLYNMVRNIVGTLMVVGRSDQPPSWIDEVLAARDRTMAGPTAPPQGLFLVHVDYGW